MVSSIAGGASKSMGNVADTALPSHCENLIRAKLLCTHDTTLLFRIVVPPPSVTPTTSPLGATVNFTVTRPWSCPSCSRPASKHSVSSG